MNFKTVHGLGRSDYALKAVNYALENGMSPHHVDSWLKWFDQQNADCHALDNFTAEQRQRMTLAEAVAANPVTLGQCGICEQCAPQVDGGSGCRNCAEGHAVMCADDCPQPEYYLGDLEEVAHAVAKLAGDAVLVCIRDIRRNADGMSIEQLDKRLAAAVSDWTSGAIAAPGYVEGLLPA